jgi:hypothetical protein
MESWDKYSKEIDNLAAVGGSYDVPRLESFAQKLGYILLNSVFSGSNPRQRIKEPKVISTIMWSLYKTEIVKKVGGFEDDLKNGGDLEFNLRLGRHGYKLLLNPEIKFNYVPRKDFVRMLKQVWNYAVAKGIFLTRGYPLYKAAIAPLFFLYVISLPILALIAPPLLLPMALYIILDLLFSLYNSLKHRDIRLLLTLPLMYFYVHFSSGLAVLLGMIFKKRFFWTKKA